MTTREKKEVILELKKKLANQELSFLIGAGFSKNVSQSFLNWEELLEDMILEMYQEEIESSFERKKGNTTVAIHRKKKIREIINRVGYLGIASEYVRRKGYHEAIDVYIENRTPYLLEENNKYYLENQNRNQRKSIDKEDLSVHRKLKELNVRYIYTFNYDNLLDVICGSNNVEALNIKMLELDDCKVKIRQLRDHLWQSQEKRKVDTSPGDPFYNSNGLWEPFHLLEEVNKIIEQLRQCNYNLKIVHADGISLTSTCIKDIEDVIFQIDNIREGIEQRIRHNYTVIDCSSKISLTENRKSIFKLHGTIRGRKEIEHGNYGFDGDLNKQYIICQEDYDSYAKDHEAFVNLMKIALLRGSFCIIGFSADDPNFLSWLSWVKNIIRRDV